MDLFTIIITLMPNLLWHSQILLFVNNIIDKLGNNVFGHCYIFAIRLC